MAAYVIGVIGAAGGVGVSTVAASIAWLIEDDRVVLVDGEPSRGAADVTAGIDHLPGPRWGDLAGFVGDTTVGSLRRALPATERYAVLAAGHGRAGPEAVVDVLRALASECSCVVVDLGSGDLGTHPWASELDLLLVMSGCSVRQAAGLRRVCADLETLSADAALVVRGPKSTLGLGEALSEFAGLPLAGHIVDDPQVAADLERGRAPGQRMRASDRVLASYLQTCHPNLVRRPATAS